MVVYSTFAWTVSFDAIMITGNKQRYISPTDDEKMKEKERVQSFLNDRPSRKFSHSPPSVLPWYAKRSQIQWFKKHLPVSISLEIGHNWKREIEQIMLFVSKVPSSRLAIMLTVNPLQVLWLRVIAANSVTFFPLWPTLLDISEEKRPKCTQITRAAWRKSLQQSSSAVQVK